MPSMQSVLRVSFFPLQGPAESWNKIHGGLFFTAAASQVSWHCNLHSDLVFYSAFLVMHGPICLAIILLLLDYNKLSCVKCGTSQMSRDWHQTSYDVIHGCSELHKTLCTVRFFLVVIGKSELHSTLFTAK